MENSNYHIIGRETVYSESGGADLLVERFKVTGGDGRVYNTHAVSTKHDQPGAVCIAVKGGKLLLAKHWRATTEEEGWELPRGMGELGETDEQTACRELLEETGYTASSARTIGRIHADTGILKDDIAVVELAVAGEQSASVDGELQDLIWIEPAQIDAMIADGKVTDGITLAAYLIWKLRN